MRAPAHKIAAAKPVRWQLSDPLRRIAEKRDAALPAERPHLAPRLQHAGLIVRRHHPDQRGTPVFKRIREPSEIDDTRGRDRNEGALFPKMKPRGLNHAWMLDRRNPRLAFACPRRMVERRVVRFRRAARPDDFPRLAAEPAGHLLTP